MSRIQVAVINEADNFTDDELNAMVAALQHQVDHDFRPTWGIAAELHAIPKGQKASADMWWIALLNDSDQANALGYHDLTPDTLHPTAKVFVNDDLKYGLAVSVTTSHELLEMLGDPYINLTAFEPGTGRLHAYEASDAVEADGLGYRGKDEVLLSDFVLPQFFDPQHSGKGDELSFCGNVTEPFQLAEGGYTAYLDLGNLEAGWQQEMKQTAGERGPGERKPGFPPGSRRERRTRRWQSQGLEVSSEALAAESAS